MMTKRVGCICLIGCVLASLVGCSSGQEANGKEGQIELLEPVNAEQNTEQVIRRDLYDTEIYSAVVVPLTEEYAYEDSVTIEQTLVYPGTEVSKGDVLFVANTDSLDNQLKSLEDTIAQMADEIQRQKEEYQAYEASAQEEINQLKQRLQGYKIGTTEYDDIYGDIELAKQSLVMKCAKLEQEIALYELDRDYLLPQIEALKEQINQKELVAGMDGTVVAMGQTGTPIVAVADMETLTIQCEFISKTMVAEAKKVYALIDGASYDVTYQPMDTAEYESLLAKGETIYSTFTINGEHEEVKAGDFAVIVMINDSREQVLTIPKAAINKDSGVNYVYKYVDGQNVQTIIHTGMSDGIYTEVTDGLSEGDHIVLLEAVEHGTNTATIEYGSFSSTFEGTGYLYYPISENVYTHITYGTMYFVEYLVEEYSHVKEGDPIASVRVVTDEIELKTLEIQIARLKERLQDMEKAGEGVTEELLQAKRQELQRAEEKRDQMLADAAITTITATSTGVIVNRANCQTDDILYNGYSITTIADEDHCYLMVEDENKLLSYGNEVVITYQDKNKETKTSYGTVASLSQYGISGALRSSRVYILLQPEDISSMAAVNANSDNWWRRNEFNVTATIREMNHVLMVPKKAVTQKNGCTYVDVVDEEGNIVSYGFIAGGYDEINYWVIDGLTEGMKICLE